MIEPNPRRAVQNLNTFHAIVAPDLCILDTPTTIQPQSSLLFLLHVDPTNETRPYVLQNLQFPGRKHMAMPPRDNLGAGKLCFESLGSFFVGGFGESRVYGENWVEKGRF